MVARASIALVLILSLMGCGGDTGDLAAVAPPPAPTPRDTVVTPYRHPSFVRDTSWNEGYVGMTLVFESEPHAKPWFFTEVTDTTEAIRMGWKAQRFEIRPGDCGGGDCTRTPVYERNEFAQAAGENLEGDEYWYGWSFYVPANIPQAHWVFFGQFQQHSNYDSVWMFLKRTGEPFCAIFDWTRNNMWSCSGQRGTYPLINDWNFAGRWHDVVVHARWTQQSNGFTRIFVDGALMVDYTGYTRTVGNSDVYFKYGIYRHSSPQTSVVYYDEIRRGRTREEVDIRLRAP